MSLSNALANGAKILFVDKIWDGFIKPTFVTGETWVNIANGFWNTIGWLNDNFGATLEALSYIGCIVGGAMFFTPLGQAILIIGEIAGLIRLLDNFRP